MRYAPIFAAAMLALALFIGPVFVRALQAYAHTLTR